MIEKSVKLGSGKFIYEEVHGWAKLPPGWDLGEVPGIAVDSQDRVYAFCRSQHHVWFSTETAVSWDRGVRVCSCVLI